MYYIVFLFANCVFNNTNSIIDNKNSERARAKTAPPAPKIRAKVMANTMVIIVATILA